MGKAKKRTALTIVIMSIIAIAILLFYYYWSNRTTSLKETSVDKRSDVEKLLDEDLVTNYPETPREVVKLFSSMTKTLYSDIKDDEAEALALKIRDLYDKEFLDKNPEETYLQNLYTEIADWKDKDRKITNFRMGNEATEQRETIDNKKYSVDYVSFTIQENKKFIKKWKVMLRLDDNKQWKILGWELASQQE